MSRAYILEGVLRVSVPGDDNRDVVRALVRGSVDGDTMGANSRNAGGKTRFEYAAVTLAATKP